MFGAWKYRDVVAQIDTGLQGGSSFASTATNSKSGNAVMVGGSNNFHKIVYRAWITGATNAATSFFVRSASSSNATFTIVDSTNLVASVSSNQGSTTLMVLDIRPEKFIGALTSTASTSTQFAWIQPYLSFSTDTATSFACDGQAYFTDYMPASNFDVAITANPTIVETDYL